MGPKLTMFMMFVFVLGTLVSLTLEGAWVGQQEMDLVNNMTGYSMIELQGAGFWAIPKMGWGFLTIGLPKVLLWDYSFFEGTWSLLRWVLVGTISVACVWGIAQMFITTVQGVFSSFFS